MNIITRKRTSHYAIIPNAVAEDERLSLEARGLLCYLLAKPDNWRVDIQNIRRTSKIGRDKAYKILKELRLAGYIEIEEKRGTDGRVLEYDYLVHDSAFMATLPLDVEAKQGEPLFLPLPDLPDTEKPEAVKPDMDLPYAENTDARINKKVNNNPESPLPPSHEFETLWAGWPTNRLPDNKQLAERLFQKLTGHGHGRVMALRYANDYVRHCLARKQKPALISYLKEKAFEEYHDAPRFDRDGDFIITPERPEWQLWLDDIAKKYGQDAAEQSRKAGKIVRPYRWPEACRPNHMPDKIEAGDRGISYVEYN